MYDKKRGVQRFMNSLDCYICTHYSTFCCKINEDRRTRFISYLPQMYNTSVSKRINYSCEVKIESENTSTMLLTRD